MCFGGRKFSVFANFSVFWWLDAAAVYSSASLASVTVFDGSSGFEFVLVVWWVVIVMFNNFGYVVSIPDFVATSMFGV